MTQPFDSISWARRLKVRHLESFLILKEAGTLSEAAKRMHMTQSAMSHWLGELEALVGVALAKRGRKVELTPAGEAMHRLAVRILGDVTRTHAELGSIEHGIAARLHVGSIAAGIALVVPLAIMSFQVTYPNVSIRVTEAPVNALLEGLEQRDLDLFVGSIDARAYLPQLSHEVLFDDQIAIVVGSHHVLARAETVQWSKLLSHPWIMPPVDTLMRQRLDTLLLEHGAAGLTPRIETSAMMTLVAILERTDHIGVCSAAMARHFERLGIIRILPTGEDVPFGPVGIVWRGGEHQILDAFIDALRSEAGRLKRAIQLPRDGRDMT